MHIDMLLSRANGPLAFRIVIQPVVAAFLAIRAGLMMLVPVVPLTDGLSQPIQFSGVL